MSDQGEVIPDEAHVVGVHFSSSEDTVCTLPLEDEKLLYRQIPENLFIDFLTEILDTISDQDRFIQLFDLSSPLCNELKRWNKKRVKWFDSEKTCSRVRETCSNEESIGEFVFPLPSEGDIKSVDILINNKIDPSGELRRKINQLIASTMLAGDAESDADSEEIEEGLDTSVDDEYPPDEEEDFDDEVQANPEKPCFYPSQIEMAAILKKRIDTIMFHYHNITSLSDVFNDVEFVVYTARYRMLSDQTEKRIRHPDAGVLSTEELKSRGDCHTKKRMFMYVHSTETEKHFQELRKDVQEKPKTLFVIIADECHWGITKDKEDKKPSAHNLFVNEWCKEDSPKNVIVVQISATPFNLLTQNSRLPLVRCVLLNDNVTTIHNDYKAGDLVVLEREHNLDEDVKNNSKEVELHVAHWSEVELKNFERGMRMKLKSALNINDAPYDYLYVSADGKLGVTSVEDDADDFIIQGSHGIVTLKVLPTKEQQQVRPLTVSHDAFGNLEAKVDPENPTKFEVKLDFGVGVFAFCSCEKQDHYIAVDKHGYVRLQAAKVEKKCGVSIMKPPPNVARVSSVSYQFFSDHCGPAEVDLVGKHYMSLNFYLSTINSSNKDEQKIREDGHFQMIVDKAKRQKKMCKTVFPSFSIDALLCAQYCYHILHASVYDCDEKIRQALKPSIDELPAAELDRKLDAFVQKLKIKKKETAKTKKPKKPCIEPEAFDFIRKELCDKAKNDLKNNLKDLTRLQKNKSTKEEQEDVDEVKERLSSSFVACLMHLSQWELQNVDEDPRSSNLVEEIKQKLQDNNCRKMLQYWNCIVQEGETSSLVENLIKSGKGKMGKMKIVRAKSMKTADQFYFTLQLARSLSGYENCFEVIRDYGGIQIENQLMKSSSPFFQKLQPKICNAKFDCCCSELNLQDGRKKCGNCQHVHKLITQYEDLENLACVLILVEKGRMGDTFPQSFDCLDLRLSYDSSWEFKEGSSLYLSTVIQELGRMCRYSKSSANEGPYVLVGRALFKTLHKSLETSPSMSAISCSKADRYMTKSTRRKDETCSSLRWLNYEAHKDSYDYQNVQKHCNRILLQAEPQIGKTGTYLCLIRDLRLDILGKEKVPLSSTPEFDEEFFYQDKEYYLSEELVVGEEEERQDWQFPYWKTIQNSPGLNEKPVASGKYSIGGCFYTHDMEESPYILMNREQREPIKSGHQHQERELADGVRAWHWYHFETCAECGRLLQGKESVLETFNVDMDCTPVRIKVSIPSSRSSFKHLLASLKSTSSTEEGINEASPPSLPYWIFHASHRYDPRKCTLNYHHVMQENGHIHSYVQIVVVRKEKFEAYRSTWGKVLAVIQLPDTLPNCDVGPSQGGVGYARLFIQMMTSALNQEYIFMIDDNVVAMSEAVFSTDDPSASEGRVVRDEKNGVMQMQRCSFLKPLTHLRKITQGKDIPAIDESKYEPHPLKHEFESHKVPLYSYTGPAKLFRDKQHESYGILGLIRSIPVAVNPFLKTQVYACILLNVKSTAEKGVFYRPWPCWEDLRFNDDCDKAGLWVVKCNRYSFLKVQYKDWINNLALPKIFEWKDDSVLEERPVSSELPKELEEGILLDHLRNFVNVQGPEKCFKACIGYDAQGVIENTASPVRIFQQLEVTEKSEESNELPFLILSYCVTNRNNINNIVFLNSIFCSTKEELVFVASAREAIKKWPQMTRATIETENGICLTHEMANRNAKFSIFSAADPKRHFLRYILIKASFPKEQENSQEKILSTRVENNLIQIGNVPNVEESAPSHYEQNVEERESSNCMQPISHAKKPVKRSPQESLDNSIEIKRRKTEEGCRQRFQGSSDDVIIIEDKCSEKSSQSKTKLTENCGVTSTATEAVPGESEHKNKRIDGIKIISVDSVDEEDEEMALEKMIFPDSNGEEYGELDNGCDISTAKEDQVISRRKRDSRNENSGFSEGADNITEGILKRKKTEDFAIEFEQRNEVIDNNQIASVDSEDDEEESLLENMDSSDEDQVIQVTSSEDQVISGRKRDAKNENSAHTEGAKDVTKIIVDLWREYRNLPGSSKKDNENKGSNDLTVEHVKEKLKPFTKDDLQAADEKGYTALLKACSLPSMSPRVMQYLISTARVDLNCQLPRHFDRNQSATEGLIPGMSALSVAIKGGNVKLVPTFLSRQKEITISSADDDGNTALHHCVLSISKFLFQNVFPLYKSKKWKDMRNKEGKNPLEIANDMKGFLLSKEKEDSITFMLKEMNRKDTSYYWENLFSPKAKDNKPSHSVLSKKPKGPDGD